MALRPDLIISCLSSPLSLDFFLLILLFLSALVNFSLFLILFLFYLPPLPSLSSCSTLPPSFTPLPDSSLSNPTAQQHSHASRPLCQNTRDINNTTIVFIYSIKIYDVVTWFFLYFALFHFLAYFFFSLPPTNPHLPLFPFSRAPNDINNPPTAFISSLSTTYPFMNAAAAATRGSDAGGRYDMCTAFRPRDTKPRFRSISNTALEAFRVRSSACLIRTSVPRAREVVRTRLLPCVQNEVVVMWSILLFVFT